MAAHSDLVSEETTAGEASRLRAAVEEWARELRATALGLDRDADVVVALDNDAVALERGVEIRELLECLHGRRDEERQIC